MDRSAALSLDQIRSDRLRGSAHPPPWGRCLGAECTSGACAILSNDSTDTVGFPMTIQSQRGSPWSTGLLQRHHQGRNAGCTGTNGVSDMKSDEHKPTKHQLVVPFPSIS